MKTCTFILDPGHGMGNRTRGTYDPGAVAAGVQEADIALAWANELRNVLKGMGHQVVRTRRDRQDPCHVSRRDDIARAYGGTAMISLHCNAASGLANGTETFYRGAEDKALAEKLNAAVCSALGTKSRGVKTEQESQHKSLAVMEFPNCWLIELGFIDHAGDRAKMLDEKLMLLACQNIAAVLHVAFAK
jgi:N-acetylmuramoyl-L-alanine amidase